MRLVSFASGSTGNCALVQDGSTCVLIDAGISLRKIRAALARRGLDVSRIDAVLITHDHSDHTRGLPMMAKYHSVPVLAPPVLARRLRQMAPELAERVAEIPKNEAFSLKDLTVTAFSTQHDTPESVGYVLEGSGRLGFCTDTGCVTEEMLSVLRGCTAALIETNHDVDRLLAGPYPAHLKHRILSQRGHLSNRAGGELACELCRSGATALMLGHLSRENNTPALALSAVRDALDAAGFSRTDVLVAPPEGDMVLEVAACCECP